MTLSDPTAFADGSTFCAFTSGEAGTQFAPLASGSCVVPQGLGGEVYVVLTSSGTTVTDEVVLAGYVASYVITRDILTDIFGCAGLRFCRYLRVGTSTLTSPCPLASRLCCTLALIIMAILNNVERLSPYPIP